MKPERKAKKGSERDAPWWLHLRARPGLRAAAAPLEHAIVAPRVTQHPNFVVLPVGRMLNEKTVVIADDRPARLGTLQSRISEAWIRFFTSTMKDDLNYAPSDCFENLPFPEPLDTKRLTAAAMDYHQHRAELMVARNQGLTKTYNRFHDASDKQPDIVRLRDLHHELDLAVLEAYGFGPADFREEVLARLLDLNRARAEEERRQGLAPYRSGADDELQEVIG